MKLPARIIAAALATATSQIAFAAEQKIKLSEAPPALLALMKAQELESPENEFVCNLFVNAKPDLVVARVFTLDRKHRLLVMLCAATRKFDDERIFVLAGDDYASAKPARLPVPKSKGSPEQDGFISDVMQAEFNEKKKELWSSTWLDGDCWRQRTWVWKSGKFALRKNSQTCAGE